MTEYAPKIARHDTKLCVNYPISRVLKSVLEQNLNVGFCKDKYCTDTLMLVYLCSCPNRTADVSNTSELFKYPINIFYIETRLLYYLKLCLNTIAVIFFKPKFRKIAHLLVCSENSFLKRTSRHSF